MRSAASVLLALVLLAPCGGAARAGTSEISQTVIESYAIVLDDASLRVQGRRIHLFGVHVPDTGRQCRARIRPARCASRAALALDRQIQGFVRCAVQERYRDRSLGAVCYVRGRSSLDPAVDLGAWLIEEGLAVAGPDAPFAYGVLERIARSQGRGVWGFFADEIEPRR